MPTKPKLRFSIASLLWLMVCVPVFFGGRWSRESELRYLRNWLGATLELNSELVAENNDLSQITPAEYLVVDVVSGDELRVVIEHRPRKVRIVGIDAPELDQPFGERAKLMAYGFCLMNNVELVDNRKDSTGTWLADVVVAGDSFRAELLRAGLAWHDTRTNADPELANLQAEAKAAKLGLWADDDAVPPWEWEE